LLVFVPSVIAAVKCIIHSPRALSDQFFWGSKHFLVPRPSHQVRVSCGIQADVSSSVFLECCLSFSFPLVVAVCCLLFIFRFRLVVQVLLVHRLFRRSQRSLISLGISSAGLEYPIDLIEVAGVFCCNKS
jgi:hypothetical protein